MTSELRIINLKYGPSDLRVCETEYWDGGEYVVCHAPAHTRSKDGWFWLCEEHAPKS